jgi:hypothetical protein
MRNTLRKAVRSKAQALHARFHARAKRAWETRRANLRVTMLKKKALKAWETRRANLRTAKAQKAWRTRRKNLKAACA